MRAFKEDMENIIRTIDTEKLPGYKRLLTEEYWKISDDQFPGVIEEVLDDIKQGKLKLVDVLKLFAYFSYFSKRKLIDYDMPTIKKKFLDGMDLAAKTSEYCDNVEEELSRIGIEVSSDMDEILEHFYKLNNSLEKQMYEKQADDIFKCIPMRMEAFYDSFDATCMNKAILNYYDPYKMFQRIMCASNEDIVLIKEMLVDRAKKNQELMKPELGFIIKLKGVIDNYYKARDVSIKMVMLKEFSNDLQTIIDLYANDSILHANEENEMNLEYLEEALDEIDND